MNDPMFKLETLPDDVLNRSYGYKKADQYFGGSFKVDLTNTVKFKNNQLSSSLVLDKLKVEAARDWSASKNFLPKRRKSGTDSPEKSIDKKLNLDL